MKIILLALALLVAAAAPAVAQGVPASATVVPNCGTPPTTYTPGQNKALLQDTTGRGCTTFTGTIGGTVTANQGAPGSSSWPVNIDQTTPGTTNGIVVGPAATVGVSTQSCTVACASTLISGAHALYGISGSATATGYIFVYDAASCAANGTVTPKKAFAYTVANSVIGISWGTIPMINSTGIAVCFSSTGPFTATASTTAFLSADFK